MLGDRVCRVAHAALVVRKEQVLSLASGGRFGRSLSTIGDLRGDGSLAVAVGGGAGTTGAIWILFFERAPGSDAVSESSDMSESCAFVSASEEPSYCRGGQEFWSNWSHSEQTVDGPKTESECRALCVQYDCVCMTVKAEDGRCIVKDEGANVAFSDEGSSSYLVMCE